MPDTLEADQKPWEIYAQKKPWELDWTAPPSDAVPSQEEQAQIRRLPRPEELTTYGGPPKHLASLAETLVEPSEEALSPRITTPKLPIKEGENKLLTIGKEAVNILSGIPEFLSSPAGVVSAVVAPAAPLTVGTVFTAAMLKDLADQIQSSYKDWDKMSGTQKTKAMTDMVGTGTFAAMPWLKPAISALRGKTTTPEVTDASKVEETTTVHGDVSAQPVESVREVPIEEGSKGVQPQAPKSEVPLTVTETTPPVPAAEMPKEPSKTGLYPAVREVGGKVDVGVPGETHPEIIKENKLKAEDIDQRGFVDKEGKFKDREQAAQQSGVPTEKEPGRQHSTDLPEAQEGQLGGGAAHVSEFPADPGDPDIYGIAARVRAQRAKAGQTVQIDPGQGVSDIEAVIHGQEVLEKNPLAAEQAVDAFKKNKSISYDGMSSTRARAEKEFQAARQTEQKLGTDSPEYQTQKAAAVEWDRVSKQMQTEWHKTGRAQQGQTDIDTGTFTGLDRAFNEQTGKSIPESHVPKAKKTAKQVSDAKNAASGAKETLFAHIRKEFSGNPAKRAFDAAKKTVREWAATKADAESALRVAQKVQADSVKKIQDAAAERAERAKNKTLSYNAKRLADEETAKRVREAKLAKDKADVEVRRQQQRIKEANNRITKAAADAAAAERKLSVAKSDLPTYVWTKAREYIEKGMDNFDDIRVKIATDEGLPLQKVTEAMGKDKRAKFLADEVWRRQQTARRLHEQAKRWLLAQMIPEYKKYLQGVPSAFFTAKVMGHGLVALGTHAPMGLFKPMEWPIYFRNFGRMYKMVGLPTPKGQAAAKAFYENQIQDMMRDPNYTMWRRADLKNDPYQYEDYNSPDMLKWMDKLTAMGNRGYSVLKMLRQDIANLYWNKLPKTAQISEVAKAIAKSANHATGITEINAPKGAAIALFAPRLEISRAQWLVTDPLKAADTFLNWKNATEGDKQFARMQVKEKAWVFGTGMALLTLNQAILSAAGSKQKINGVPESLGGAGFDPMRSDFLKFKALGMQGSYGNAMTAMARLPARLFVGIENEGKLNKIVYEDENVASILFDFTRSQMSPFMGTATDLAIGRDFQRRPLPRAGFGLLPGKTNVPKRLKAQGVGPYTWAEYISVQATPIPASEAIREVWKAGLGMSEEQIHDYMKAFAILSIMTGTGARITEDYNIPKQ